MSTLLTWSLVNLCSCAIITTSVVMQLISFPLVREDDWSEYFDRVLKSSSLFLLIDLVSSIVMVTLSVWAWIPMILHLFGLGLTCISFYAMYKLSNGNSVNNEDYLRRSSILRALILFARFLCVFVLIVSPA